jgi:aminotransferase
MRNYISQRVASVPPSGIRRFFDIAATMKDVISLGIGEPDFVTPPNILEAGLASLRRGDTHYTSNSGTVELRRALSDHLGRLYGVRYDPETELLITVGVSEALYLALTAILDPGDEVIVPQPCFVAYSAEVVFAGGVPVTIATKVENNFQVTGAEIEAKITPKTKAILIGYPNNPTGAVMSRERLLEIAALAEKHDLLVLSDEIYDRLVYAPMSGDGAGAQHTCFPALPGMRERTLLLGGWSKDYAMTGWRIGYAAAPVELSAAMRKVHQYTIMSAPTTAQAAALEALQHGDEHVEAMRQEYDRRRRLIVSGLNHIGLKTFEPQGAFYAFPSITASGMSDAEFAEQLLREEQVAVVPGNAFGAGGEGFVRCCYATAYEQIEQALERMHRFLRRHG